MTEKMITQRVKLSPTAHALIAEAQKELGLARFPIALGYLLEGLLIVGAPRHNISFIADFMRMGMGAGGIENVDNSKD